MPARLAVLTLSLLLGIAACAPAKTLVRYTRSGGIAGEETSLKVGTAGAATLRTRADPRRDFKLSGKRLRALKRALTEARFSELKPDYGPEKGVVSDGIAETVTYARRTVTVQTGGDPPARLERLMARLDALTR